MKSLKNRLKKLEEKLQPADDVPVIDLRELSEEELEYALLELEKGNDVFENCKIIPESPDLQKMTEEELNRELENLTKL